MVLPPPEGPYQIRPKHQISKKTSTHVDQELNYTVVSNKSQAHSIVAEHFPSIIKIKIESCEHNMYLRLYSFLIKNNIIGPT